MTQHEQYQLYLRNLHALRYSKESYYKRLCCVKRVQPGNRPEYFKAHKGGYCFEYADLTPLFIANTLFAQTVQKFYTRVELDDYQYSTVSLDDAIKEVEQQTLFFIRFLNKATDNVK